jgi:hypothetical protein
MTRARCSSGMLRRARGPWRAYTFDGTPITSPQRWFGETPLQQKSSTASVIPLLLQLYRLTADDRWLAASLRAGRFVRMHYVDGLKFNGGIHDSIYFLAQLVDREGILFPLRAMLDLYRVTGGVYFRDGAHLAARLLATWICYGTSRFPKTAPWPATASAALAGAAVTPTAPATSRPS